MYACREEILKHITSILEEDKNSYKEFLTYANKILASSNGKCEGCIEAGDILHSIVYKLLAGKRKWDYDKYTDFKIYFLMLIKSEVFNSIKHRKKTVRESELIFNKELQDRGGKETNENLLIADMSSEIETQDIKERCMKLLEGDEDAQLILLECLEGRKNIDIAEDLGVDIGFVENCKKRMRRKVGRGLGVGDDMKVG